ncbi:MAG: acetamidase/formamidase family protein [Haloarculaceae archaeon]
MTPPAPDHRLDASDPHVHRDWDPDRDPVLTVDPGDVVAFECRDATDGHLSPDSTVEDVLTLDFQGHPLTGPVAVAGATPGDALLVDVLAVDHHGVGYTYFYPGAEGKGLLPDEFPAAGLHVWDLGDGVGRFVNGIEVPLAPFPGNLGAPPAEPGPHSTTPPRRVGGNLDVRHLTAGATLRLPVEVEGALFSVGDGHAAQGDGEVCVTGVETPTTVTARFRLDRDGAPDRPEFETTGPYAPAASDGPAYGTTGVAPDLMDATADAVRGMIDHLHAERGLSRAEAYVLCSAAVDLKLSEVVNAPNWVVSAYVPESIFPD